MHMFGADLQSLLKLFEWIVDDENSSKRITLPQPSELSVGIIY